MKKLSEIHIEQDASLARIAKQHGFKMNEDEAQDGVMAEFTMVMSKCGEDAEIKIMANNEVIASCVDSMLNVGLMYETILNAAKEIIGTASK